MWGGLGQADSSGKERTDRSGRYSGGGVHGAWLWKETEGPNLPGLGAQAAGHLLVTEAAGDRSGGRVCCETGPEDCLDTQAAWRRRWVGDPGDISMSSQPRGACRVSERDRSEERIGGGPSHGAPVRGWPGQPRPGSRACLGTVSERGLNRGARHLCGGHLRVGRTDPRGTDSCARGPAWPSLRPAPRAGGQVRITARVLFGSQYNFSRPLSPPR